LVSVAFTSAALDAAGAAFVVSFDTSVVGAVVAAKEDTVATLRRRVASNLFILLTFKLLINSLFRSKYSTNAGLFLLTKIYKYLCQPVRWIAVIASLLA